MDFLGDLPSLKDWGFYALIVNLKKLKNEKALLVMTMMWASVLVLTAQEETLFGRSHSVGFFVSPIIEYSSLNNEIRATSGGGLGLVVDNFFIGGYGLAAIDFDRLIDTNGDRLDVDLAHSGLWLGYVFPFPQSDPPLW